MKLKQLLLILPLLLIWVNPITVKAEETNYPYYLDWKQCSPEWANETIKNSGNTMTNGACSETSQAIIIQMSKNIKDHNFNPLNYLRWAEENNQKFSMSTLDTSAVTSYTDGNLQLVQSIRDISYNDDSAIYNLIKYGYDNGYFMILHIRHTNGGGHFVPVVAIDTYNKDIYINQVGRNDLPGYLNYVDYYGSSNSNEIMDGVDFYKCKDYTMFEFMKDDNYTRTFINSVNPTFETEIYNWALDKLLSGENLNSPNALIIK